ncbi:hypothetical protein MIR68_003037 [Amoeboaphelidium protococcarum]|nr:hypothetical protein MIR68_003037 [Amoeboaphelidium protococcarum]
MGKRGNKESQHQHKPSQDTPKAEHSLQAVVIADFNEHRFRPLTLSTPRCLLPLVNVPMINYTMEFLAMNKVDEVFVFCKSHAQQVRSYLQQSKWISKQRGMKVHVIALPGAHSVGDVMRELDAKSLIDTDFILVSGNLVSNMNIEVALEAHRQIKVRDKEAIMTMIALEAQPFHRSRARGETALMALNPLTMEVVHYENCPQLPPPYSRKMPKVKLDMELFHKTRALQLRNDLIDCQVDICSVEVPALFTENFDYQEIRKHFVHGVLTSDLLKKTIYVHVVRDEYCARLRSTHTYDAVSRDIVERWTYPLTVDNLVDVDQHTDSVKSCDDCSHVVKYQSSGFRVRPNNVYVQHQAQVADSAQLGQNVVISRGSSVGGRCKITQSVLGRDCRIGSGVRAYNCHIWNGVSVGDNCSMEYAIIGHNCVIKNNVSIGRGCVIGDNVVLGPDVQLKPYTKLTVDLPDHVNAIIEEAIVGKDGNAFVWYDTMEQEDSDEDEDNFTDDETERVMHQMQQMGFDLHSLQHGGDAAFVNSNQYGHVDDAAVHYDLISELSSADVHSRTNTGGGLPFGSAGGSQGGRSSSGVGGGYMSEDEQEEYLKHLTEVTDTFKRAVVEQHTVDNALLELNALKMACNINFHDLRQGVITGLLSLVVGNDYGQIEQNAVRLIGSWAELIIRFVVTQNDQMDLLQIALNESIMYEASSAKLLMSVITQFYQQDIVDGEVIEEWFEDATMWNPHGEIGQKIKSHVQKFVEWLQDDDDDDEEDEYEDEDDNDKQSEGESA